MAKGRKRKDGRGRRGEQSPGVVTATTCSSAFECGIVLTGTEVKSLREGKAQLKDSYASSATARCG